MRSRTEIISLRLDPTPLLMWQKFSVPAPPSLLSHIRPTEHRPLFSLLLILRNLAHLGLDTSSP